MEKKLKVLTYNVDGLPQTLDLRNLPWWLKPVCWIYKLIKKTTFVRINDNDNHSHNISSYLFSSKADIIALQEDFNYHKELSFYLSDLYIDNTNTGNISFSNIKWLPYPRFKADGINLFTKIGSVRAFDEEIIKWNKSNGYFNHANDLLTTKGFRYYNLFLDNGCKIDLYIIHMDADFYDKTGDATKDLEARKLQLQQLVNFIKEKSELNHDPIIIVGDTNSYNKYVWDENNIKINLIHELNHEPELTINEAIPDNFSDCDRVFYINDCYSMFELKLEECHFDTDITFSDHYPLITTFNVILKEN